MEMHNTEMAYMFALGSYFTNDRKRRAIYKVRFEKFFNMAVQLDMNHPARAFNWAFQFTSQLIYFMTENSVIRGGYGIVYPTSAAQGMRDAIATNTFNQSVRNRQTLGLPLGINPAGGNFPRGLTPFNNATLSSVQGIAANAIPFNLQSPRIEQFNVTYEREIKGDLGLRVSYIGSRQHVSITFLEWLKINGRSVSTSTRRRSY